MSVRRHHLATAVLLTGALGACTAPNLAYNGPAARDSGAPAAPEIDAGRPPIRDTAAPLSKPDAGAPDTSVATPDAGAAPRPPLADAAAPAVPSPDLRPDLGAPPAGLLAYWTFDDGPSTRSARDWSGRDRHGVLENLDLASAWAAGRPGQGMALSLPAVTNAAQPPRVRVSQTTDIDSLQAFTISVWFYRTAVPANTHDPIISRQLGTNNNEVFNLTCNEDDLIIYIPPAPTGGSQITFEVRAQNICLLKTWVHAAATYNGRTLSLFVGGMPAGQRDFPDRLRASPGAPIFIGANQNSTFTETFEGLIDEVSLFSRALSPAEIGTLASGGTPFDL